MGYETVIGRIEEEKIVQSLKVLKPDGSGLGCETRQSNASSYVHLGILLLHTILRTILYVSKLLRPTILIAIQHTRFRINTDLLLATWIVQF